MSRSLRRSSGSQFVGHDRVDQEPAADSDAATHVEALVAMIEVYEAKHFPIAPQAARVVASISLQKKAIIRCVVDPGKRSVEALP